MWAVALAVVAGLLAVGLSRPRATAGRLAPVLPREVLAGGPVTLASLLGVPRAVAPVAGKPTRRVTGAGGAHAALVLFWASDCEPCQHEAAAVERFAQSAAGRGRIVGIDYGESESAAPRAFVRRYRWSFPNLSDPDGRAGEAYGVTGLPTTYVIDANGRIHATLPGPQTEQSLTRALAGAGSSGARS